MNAIGPFTGPQVAQIFDCIGLPAHGITINTLALVHYPFSNVDTWNPTWNHGDIAALVADIKVKLALVDVDSATIVQADLVTWQDIRDSEMSIETAANGVSGRVVDDAERRRILRIRIANNLGISVPKDGFLAEIEAVYGKSLKEFRSGGGLADR